MKIKKSKFAKLLTLALPIAAISIVTPVVLTSCGSSNSTTTPDKPDNGGSGGGTSGGGSTGGDTGGSSGDTTKPESYTASWDTTKKIDDLSFDDDIATVTLKDSGNFGNTGLSKASKYSDIVNSLEPKTQSKINFAKEDNEASTATTLYSVLSSVIKNIDKFTVKLSIDPNPIVFDFTNDSIGNTFSGKFELTPITSVNSGTKTTLNFTINNFDDSTNISNTLTWDTNAVTNALKKDTPNTGNNISDDAAVKTMGDGASAVIDLSKLSSDKKPTYSQVMNELCNTSISGDEVNNFIKSNNKDSYDVSKASFSAWAPTVDQKMIFTRIVIPNSDANKPSAIMYLAYTGYTNDSGSAAWNRNLGYYITSDSSKDLWDVEWNEPVINLDENKLWDTNITSDSNANEIKTESSKLATYIATNYILDVSNFDLDVSGDKVQVGSFNENGEFKSSEVAVKESNADTTLKNNANVIQIKFLLKLKEGQSVPKALDGKKLLSGYNELSKGFWKAFYITGYNTKSN